MNTITYIKYIYLYYNFYVATKLSTSAQIGLRTIIRHK